MAASCIELHVVKQESQLQFPPKPQAHTSLTVQPTTIRTFYKALDNRLSGVEMFSIDRASIPVLPTCQALIVIDLQNDLLSPGCKLPVNDPDGLLDNIIGLATEFRKNGKVIWVRSQFEAHRPINDGEYDSEEIVTEAHIRQGMAQNKIQNRGMNGRMTTADLQRKVSQMQAELEVEDGKSAAAASASSKRTPEDQEAFLTVIDGLKPIIMLPLTTGTNFSPKAVPFMSTTTDIFFAKSHYSAFKTDGLLQALRRQFVTELYICGALTNVSVFATAMDAAMHGYHIILVSDCCGYVSQGKHDEALRRLQESTGCDVLTQNEVLEQRRVLLNPPINQRPSSSRHVNIGRDARGVGDIFIAAKTAHQKTQNPKENTAPNQSATRLVSSNEISHLQDPDVTPRIQRSESHESSDASASHKQESQSAIQVHEDYIVPQSKSDARLKASRPREASIGFDEDNGNHESSEAILATGDDDSHEYPLSQLRYRRAMRGPHEVKDRSRSSRSSHNHSGNAASAQVSTSEAVTAASDAMDRMSLSKSKKPDQTASSKFEAASTQQIVAPPLAGGISRVLDGGENCQEGNTSSSFRPLPPLPESGVKSRSTESNQQPQALEGDKICEGDTTIIQNLMAEASAKTIFERVRDEVQWQNMLHLGGEVPRLIAVQGELGDDGSIPVYRHPADESPPLRSFTKAVSEIQLEVEKALGHRVNHCLIQLYRDGTDFISEHSDKTLDIDQNSYIANVSLGATRTMTFRTKRPPRDWSSPASSTESFTRRTERAPLPHNSLCRMGLKTNAKWLHSIRADKRRLAEKTPEEISFEGQRISLTFRLISTFLSPAMTHIFGQGASSKSAKAPSPILSGDINREQAGAMIMAFGIENQSSVFDWNAAYGKGFDVLHMTNTARLFLSRTDSISNMKIRLMLHEHNVPYVTSSASPPFLYKGGASSDSASIVPKDLPMRFVDNNVERTTVEGDTAITFYLETYYGLGADREALTKQALAKELTRMQSAQDLGKLWKAEPLSEMPFRKCLALWNTFAKEEMDGYISGKKVGLADYAFWPVLREVVNNWGWNGIENDGSEQNTMNGLKGYWERMGKKASVIALLKELDTENQDTRKA